MTGSTLLGVFILGVCVGAVVHYALQAVELVCSGSRRAWRAKLATLATGRCRCALAWLSAVVTWAGLGVAALTPG